MRFMVKHNIWGKKEDLEKYKISGSKVWEKNECKSKKAEKVGYDREKKFQEREVTGKVYSENTV